MKLVIVTGALGFVGRQVVSQLLARGDRVYVVDAQTYAADKSLIAQWGVTYSKGDIADLMRLPEADALINLAAETHVDNSIRDARVFGRSNVLGVQNLLELCRGKELPPRFIQISTDEVYGDVDGADESFPLKPSSPYAASKASADLWIQAYGRTYDLPYCILRPSNCYGPHQYPEKLIPKAVRNTWLGRPMPLHAGGTPVRSWLAVEDCARAILAVLDKGENQGIYNVEGNTLASVVEVLGAIAKHLGRETVATPVVRPGLDTKYQVTGEPLKALGWKPHGDLWADLPALVEAERHSLRW